MDGQELFLKSGKSANIWYCGECKIIAIDKEVADNCCKKNNCCYCGEVVDEKHWLAHRDCIEKESVRKAEKLETWDGWVYYGDEYYSNTEELIEELEDSGEKIPEYVCVCKTIPFPAIDIENLIEHIEENNYESIRSQLKGIDELSEAIKNFNDVNKQLVSYLPDKKMVRLNLK